MEWSVKKIMWIALSVVALVLIISYSGRMAEEVGSGEIVVIQHPFSGELDVYTTPGTYSQYGGHATHYKRRSNIWFSKNSNQGEVVDQSIKIRFNDGGHATISGSVSMQLPLDKASIIAFHTNFGSQEAIEHDLVTTVIQKAIYMTGPLMSSKESYAEKRNDLISYIDDQASNGVYKTTQKDVKQLDALTNAEKIVTVVDIQKDSKGNILRQEKSPIQHYKIALSNFSINGVDYDNSVEKQIKSQQALTMQVQTSIANAKKSEQDALTAEQKGKADAASAKWTQEVIKVRLITKAQQEKEIAALEVQTALLNKQRDILDGEAAASVKKLAMSANGALETKLEAWVKVNSEYAKALTNSTWVPTTVIGGNGTSSFSPNTLIDMMMVKTAKELSLPAVTK